MTNILLFFIFIGIFVLIILKLKELKLMEKQVNFILTPCCLVYFCLLSLLFLDDLYRALRHPQLLFFNNYTEYGFISLAFLIFIFIRKKMKTKLSFVLSFLISYMFIYAAYDFFTEIKKQHSVNISAENEKISVNLNNKIKSEKERIVEVMSENASLVEKEAELKRTGLDIDTLLHKLDKKEVKTLNIILAYNQTFEPEEVMLIVQGLAKAKDKKAYLKNLIPSEELDFYRSYAKQISSSQEPITELIKSRKGNSNIEKYINTIKIADDYIRR